MQSFVSVLRRHPAMAATVALFVAVQIILGILLQLLPGRTGVALSYAAIILACLFCLVWMEPTRPYLLTQAALLCTVCADYFLVWCEPQIKLPAMIFFLVAQLLYATRLWDSENRPSYRRWHVPTRMLLSVAILAVTPAVLQASTDALALVSMVYYVNLILNLLFSFLQFRKQPLLSVGFLLFLLCDTVIGLNMLDAYLPISRESLLYAVIDPGFNLAWAFYLPSQTLLAISLLPSYWKRAVSVQSSAITAHS